MVLLQKFTYENLEKIESSEAEDSDITIETFNEAIEIISKYLYSSPDLLEQHPELYEVSQTIKNSVREKQNQQEYYWENVRQERREKRLKHGVPPINNICPKGYPIRATQKLSSDNEKRGIYYYKNERKGMEVDWCFADEEEAEAENFRRPKGKQPEYQPRKD
jgi:hypothetical protein